MAERRGQNRANCGYAKWPAMKPAQLIADIPPAGRRWVKNPAKSGEGEDERLAARGGTKRAAGKPRSFIHQLAQRAKRVLGLDGWLKDRWGALSCEA
jgi:hypothetical protein